MSTDSEIQPSDFVVFDDDYGVWTAEDHARAAAETWALLDGAKPN